MAIVKVIAMASVVWVGVLPSVAQAQKKFPSAEDFTSSPYLALAALSIIPLLFITTTSFVKISVVLAILRNALGTPQIPSTTVVSALAAILTLYVMAPVGQEIYEAVQAPMAQVNSNNFSPKDNFQAFLGVFDAAKEPFRDFLSKNSGEKEQSLFFELAKSRQMGDSLNVEQNDFWVIYPAFLITELAEAFKMGFFLFLPFLVVDLVVSNILLALGMHMMNPSSISLPFKILLFVLVDGWYLLAKSLVLNYA